MEAFMACASLLIIAVTVNSNAIPQDHSNRLRDQLRSTACVDIAGAVACNKLKQFCSEPDVPDACCATCGEYKRDTVIKSKGLMKTRHTCVDEYSAVACNGLRRLCSTDESVAQMCCQTCVTNTGRSLLAQKKFLDHLRRYLDEDED